MGFFRAKLQVAKGAGVGSSVEVGDSPVLIGRGDECDLRLDDDYLSSRHARVSWRGSQLILEDMGSTNGLYVNGQRAYSTNITLGDVVHIGHSALVVVGAPSGEAES